jgi:hypothetical protein
VAFFFQAILDQDINILVNSLISLQKVICNMSSALLNIHGKCSTYMKLDKYLSCQIYNKQLQYVPLNLFLSRIKKIQLTLHEELGMQRVIVQSRATLVLLSFLIIIILY